MKTIVVAGDSIVKFLEGSSNAERNVSVKSFSGATVNNMSDFTKNPCRNSLNYMLVKGSDTNELRHSNPTEVAGRIIELAEKFKKKCNHTEVPISSLQALPATEKILLRG